MEKSFLDHRTMLTFLPYLASSLVNIYCLCIVANAQRLLTLHAIFFPRLTSPLPFRRESDRYLISPITVARKSYIKSIQESKAKPSLQPARPSAATCMKGFAPQAGWLCCQQKGPGLILNCSKAGKQAEAGRCCERDRLWVASAWRGRGLCENQVLDVFAIA